MCMPLPDPYERFAAQVGLHLTIEPITLAPRDLLATLVEMEQHYLVTLAGPGTPAIIRLVFAKAAVDPAPPTVRDALWWLAGDAWAVDRHGGAIESWARTYGHPLDAPATARRFALRVAQARLLQTVLGSDGYRRLLALYERDLAGTPSRPDEPGMRC